MVARDRLGAIGAVLALFLFVLFVAYGIWGIERPMSFLRAIVIGTGILGLTVTLARLLQIELSLFEIPILTEFSGRRARGNVLGIANNGLSGLLEPGVAGGIGLAILNRKRRWLYLSCGLFAAAGVLVTFSRGGMVGVAASLLTLCLLNARYIRRYWKVAAITVLLVALVLTSLIATLPGLGSRISSITSIEKNIGRVWIWTAALKMVKDHPVFGSGPGNFGKLYLEYRVLDEYRHARSPHSLYLFVLTGWGMVGFMLFYGYLTWKTIRPLVLNPSPYRVLALSMVVSFWVHVLVEDLYLPHIPLIMGCITNPRLLEQSDEELPGL